MSAPREHPPPPVAAAVVLVSVEVGPAGSAVAGGVVAPLVVAPASGDEEALSVVCEVPFPPWVTPTVRGGYDVGDWQVLTDVAVEVSVPVAVGVAVGG